MTARPTFEQIYMELAHRVAERSTCARTSSAGEPMRVGCVVVAPDWRKVLALGYNGNATGLPNSCDSSEPGACGCLHAEENAIINCDAPRGARKIVFCTHQPCKMCAKRLVNLGGVERVFYARVYRLRDGLDVLHAAGIPAILFPSVSG